MGAWKSGLENSIRKVLIFFFQRRGMNNNERALQALFTWCENHELHISEGDILNLHFWQRVGQNIFEAVSFGDDAAIGIIKPWTLVLDLLFNQIMKGKGEGQQCSRLFVPPWA